MRPTPPPPSRFGRKGAAAPLSPYVGTKAEGDEPAAPTPPASPPPPPPPPAPPAQPAWVESWFNEPGMAGAPAPRPEPPPQEPPTPPGDDSPPDQTVTVEEEVPEEYELEEPGPGSDWLYPRWGRVRPEHEATQPSLVPDAVRGDPTYQAFLKDAAARPGDDTPLLVLADWLEERTGVPPQAANGVREWVYDSREAEGSVSWRGKADLVSLTRTINSDLPVGPLRALYVARFGELMYQRFPLPDVPRVGDSRWEPGVPADEVREMIARSLTALKAWALGLTSRDALRETWAECGAVRERLRDDVAHADREADAYADRNPPDQPLRTDVPAFFGGPWYPVRVATLTLEGSLGVARNLLWHAHDFVSRHGDVDSASYMVGSMGMDAVSSTRARTPQLFETREIDAYRRLSDHIRARVDNQVYAGARSFALALGRVMRSRRGKSIKSLLAEKGLGRYHRVPPSPFRTKAEEPVTAPPKAPTPPPTPPDAPEGSTPPQAPTAPPAQSQAGSRGGDRPEPLPQAPAAPQDYQEPPAEIAQVTQPSTPAAPALPRLEYPSTAPVILAPRNRQPALLARGMSEFAGAFLGRPERVTGQVPPSLQALLAGAVAAPDDAQVNVVEAGQLRGRYHVEVSVKHPLFSRLDQTFTVDPDGSNKTVHNDHFSVRNPSAGTGAQTFARQCSNTARLGFEKIKMLGVSAKLMNGAYTWVTLGANCRIDQMFFEPGDEIIPRLFPDAVDLLDVLATPKVNLDRNTLLVYARALNDAEREQGRKTKERFALNGREWWKAHCSLMAKSLAPRGRGYGQWVTFDLKEGSKSWRALNAYLAAVGGGKKALPMNDHDDERHEGSGADLYLTPEQEDAVDRAWEQLCQNWHTGQRGTKDYQSPLDEVPDLYAALDGVGDAPERLIEVPDIRQRDDYSCLACAAASCAFKYGVGPGHELWQKYRNRWYDKKVQDQLTHFIEEWKKILGTNRVTSTHPRAIVGYLESLGLQVEARDKLTLQDLADYWKKDWPVICMIQEYGEATKEKHPDVADEEVPGTDRRPAAFDYGHGVVYVGGPALGLIFVQDPSIDNLLQDENADAAKGLMTIPVLEWLKVWHDRDQDDNKFIRFGIAVGPLREGVSAEQDLRAAKALEETPAGNVFGMPQVSEGPLPPQESPLSYRFDGKSCPVCGGGVKDIPTGWRCEDVSCEWSVFQAGGDSDQDKYPQPPISNQEGWERAHADRREQEVKALPQDVEAAARKTDPDPGEKAKKSGNYKKGVVTIQGLSVAIETPRGGVRSGRGKDGKPWAVIMKHHYGYIRKTESDADGDEVDVFIGPDPESPRVFVIDQLKDDGSFDEHKCLIGWRDQLSAEYAYRQCYAPDWKGLGAITAMSMDEFKRWLKQGDTGAPISGQKSLPGLGNDFTFYLQAYDRWRVKPDVLGERRVRLGWERGTPADQLAIQNDEEFRDAHEGREPLENKSEKMWGTKAEGDGGAAPTPTPPADKPEAATPRQPASPPATPTPPPPASPPPPPPPDDDVGPAAVEDPDDEGPAAVEVPFPTTAGGGATVPDDVREGGRYQQWMKEIESNPGDDTPLLVMADWLEEHTNTPPQVADNVRTWVYDSRAAESGVVWDRPPSDVPHEVEYKIDELLPGGPLRVLYLARLTDMAFDRYPLQDVGGIEWQSGASFDYVTGQLRQATQTMREWALGLADSSSVFELASRLNDTYNVLSDTLRALNAAGGEEAAAMSPQSLLLSNLRGRVDFLSFRMARIEELERRGSRYPTVAPSPNRYDNLSSLGHAVYYLSLFVGQEAGPHTQWDLNAGVFSAAESFAEGLASAYQQRQGKSIKALLGNYRKAWGDRCPDGHVRPPNVQTCHGREGGWDGMGSDGRGSPPEESWYPDYAPTSGVPPVRDKGVPTQTCPDGSPMPVSTGTCAGREAWLPWTEEQRQQNELYEHEVPSSDRVEHGPIKAKYPNAPRVPPSRFGRKHAIFERPLHLPPLRNGHDDQDSYASIEGSDLFMWEDKSLGLGTKDEPVTKPGAPEAPGTGATPEPPRTGGTPPVPKAPAAPKPTGTVEPPEPVAPAAALTPDVTEDAWAAGKPDPTDDFSHPDASAEMVAKSRFDAGLWRINQLNPSWGEKLAEASKTIPQVRQWIAGVSKHPSDLDEGYLNTVYELVYQSYDNPALLERLPKLTTPMKLAQEERRQDIGRLPLLIGIKEGAAAKFTAAADAYKPVPLKLPKDKYPYPPQAVGLNAPGQLVFFTGKDDNRVLQYEGQVVKVGSSGDHWEVTVDDVRRAEPEGELLTGYAKGYANGSQRADEAFASGTRHPQGAGTDFTFDALPPEGYLKPGESPSFWAGYFDGVNLRKWGAAVPAALGDAAIFWARREVGKSRTYVKGGTYHATSDLDAYIPKKADKLLTAQIYMKYTELVNEQLYVVMEGKTLKDVYPDDKEYGRARMAISHEVYDRWQDLLEKEPYAERGRLYEIIGAVAEEVAGEITRGTVNPYKWRMHKWDWKHKALSWLDNALVPPPEWKGPRPKHKSIPPSRFGRVGFKANYSGVFYDSLGRKTCYIAGRKVPCAKDEQNLTEPVGPRPQGPSPELARTPPDHSPLGRERKPDEVEGERPELLTTYAVVFDRSGKVLVRKKDELLGGFVWTVEVPPSEAGDNQTIHQAVYKVTGAHARRFGKLARPEEGQGYYLLTAPDGGDVGGEDTTWQSVDKVLERISESHNPTWRERGKEILEAAYEKWDRKGKTVARKVRRSPFGMKQPVGQKDEELNPVPQTSEPVKESEPAAVLEPHQPQETLQPQVSEQPVGGGGEGGEATQLPHPSPTGTTPQVDLSALREADSRAKMAEAAYADEVKHAPDPTVAGRMKQALTFVQGRAKKKYQELEQKYGRETALAVIIAGQGFSWGAFVAGLAAGKTVIIPSFLTTVLAAAVADLYHKVKGTGKKELPQVGLPPEEIQKLADAVMRELGQEFVQYLQTGQNDAT